MKIVEQIKKYRGMKNIELAAELKSINRELTLSSLKVKVGKQTDNSQIKKMKRNVARIKSIISEKAYGVENE